MNKKRYLGMTGYLTIKEFVARTGLGRSHVESILDAGILPHLKVGKRARFIPISALKAFQLGEVLTVR